MNAKVTALKVQKRNPNRVNVYLDGEYAFGLAHIVAAWLQVGQELTSEQIDKLQNQDMSEVAYQSALRFLNYRARSVAEVRKKLNEKGFSEPTIEQILERLEKSGLLNDNEFAHAWVENQTIFRPRGRRLMKYELRQKGLDEEKIEQALEEMPEEESLAYNAAQRTAQRLADREWIEFRQKLSQFLARRGFNYETIVPTVSKLWNELHSEES